MIGPGHSSHSSIHHRVTIVVANLGDAMMMTMMTGVMVMAVEQGQTMEIGWARRRMMIMRMMRRLMKQKVNEELVVVVMVMGMD